MVMVLLLEVHATNFHHQLVLLNLPIKRNSTKSNSSKSWDAIAAAQTSSGTFKVLAEGEGSKSGQVYAFSTDKAGSLQKVVQAGRVSLQLSILDGKVIIN